MKYTLHAVIPTQQYGNLQPSIEVEADTFEEAHAQAMPHIQKVWDEYGEKPLTAKVGATKRLKDMFGNEIDYDEVNHIYSWEGEKYTSGSEYAKSRQKPFDPVMMSGQIAKKFGVDPKEIAQLWERGGKVSRDFGLNVHEALEVYGKFKSLSDSVEKEYHIPNHPILKDIVEGFYESRDDEKALYEVLVVDHKNKRAGTIDRLLEGPEVNSYIIQDFKITHKENKEYWTDQLGFYGEIIKSNGAKVWGKEIYQYNGGWKKINV